jgi:nitrite reductase/ring-hydroxylating ferredoxin subunit
MLGYSVGLIQLSLEVSKSGGDMAEYFKVATTSDIAPGCGAVVEVNGRSIALFNVNGRFYALDNTCLHRGGPLGDGHVDVNNATVQCPWHGWLYSLTTGVSPVNESVKVECFEVQVEGDDVKIAL